MVEILRTFLLCVSWSTSNIIYIKKFHLYLFKCDYAVFYFQLHCCGVENYTDWQEWPYGSNGNVSRGCCKEDDRSDTCYMNKNTLPEDQAKDYIYTEGCYEAIKEDLKEEVVALCVILFIMVVVQVSAWIVRSA